jgi:UDP-N-acetylglucosamine 2-epimerase (non-hydrolysing)
MTILGTRPEIIRLSEVIKRIDPLCDHVLVHTGQNYDPLLYDVFFDELGLRRPDHYLGVRWTSLGEQIGRILIESERVLREVRPDRLLILGDTNSCLAAIVAKRMGIPVYHLEAGNRCYDDRVPEEVNRRLVDHSSDVEMAYTERCRQNLLREGIPGDRIYVVGNPIWEVIQVHQEAIAASDALGRLELEPGGYFLVTTHRQENVDSEDRLRSIARALTAVAEEYSAPVVCSIHPRTMNRMAAFGLKVDDRRVRLLQPFGFFDFVALQRQAKCVISDSGTVQEESCILGVPNVTMRDVTERPETLECGSSMLSGVAPETVLRCVRVSLSQQARWTPPAEFLAENVSAAVAKIVLGYRRGEAA